VASNIIPLPNTQPAPDVAIDLPIPDRAVYTVKDLAYLLSLPLGATYALIRSGDIPASRLGRRWVMPRRRFEEWLDNLPEASLEDVERELAKLDAAEGGH
jgi:excisionase family DNA binding protein